MRLLEKIYGRERMLVSLQTIAAAQDGAYHVFV